MSSSPVVGACLRIVFIFALVCLSLFLGIFSLALRNFVLFLDLAHDLLLVFVANSSSSKYLSLA